MSRPLTTVALLARPQWRGLSDETSLPVDPRIWAAPLQVLEPESIGEDLRSETLGFLSRPASTRWAIFTSPASVTAYEHWVQTTARLTGQPTGPRAGQQPTPQFDRFAAVGTGTADQMRRAVLQTDSALVVGAGAATADALATVHAIADQVQSEGLAWKDQCFVIMGGTNNRPTLAEGLATLGATVMSLPLYSRRDVEWSDAVWKRLSESPRETAIVVTSSTVVDRLMQSLVTHGIDPVRLTWATHHATIAAKLVAYGVSPIRRVRLDPPELSKDLFDYEQYW